MRNIKIIFPELGLGSLYQAQVYIRNKETDWSINTKTYNKELEICLKENQAYYLYARSYLGIIELFFYVDCKRNKYYFTFQISSDSQHDCGKFCPAYGERYFPGQPVCPYRHRLYHGVRHPADD